MPSDTACVSFQINFLKHKADDIISPCLKSFHHILILTLNWQTAQAYFLSLSSKPSRVLSFVSPISSHIYCDIIVWAMNSKKIIITQIFFWYTKSAEATYTGSSNGSRKTATLRQWRLGEKVTIDPWPGQLLTQSLPAPWVSVCWSSVLLHKLGWLVPLLSPLLLRSSLSQLC